MTGRKLLALLYLGTAASCYSYAETSLESVTPGSEVRVRVTAETASRLRDALAQDQRSVEGRVKAHQGGALLLDVVASTRQVGFRFEQFRQTIRLEPADATLVESKTFSRRRTALALTTVGIVTGAIAWEALSGNAGGDTRPPDGGGPADSRVPWLSVRIPTHFRLPGR